MRLRLTMMGRSYDVAAQLPDELVLASPSRVNDALRAVSELLPPREPLSPSCLVVLNGQHLGTIARHDNPALAERDDLLLIAPVAGG